MMRTIKNKIHPWKMVAMASLIPLSFFMIACQDQIANEIANSTATQTTMYPAAAESDMQAFKQKNPGATFTYIEGQEAEINKITSFVESTGEGIIVNTYDLSSEGVDKKGLLFTKSSEHAKALRTEDKIFTVVEESASFNGGQPKLLEHLQNTIKYPESARKSGKGGTVYIQFVVNEDGALSDFRVLKQVDPELDAEALRAVKTLPSWNPGKQQGVAVKQRYVLPISFNPDFEQSHVESISASLYKMDVTYKKKNTNGKTIVEGTATSRESQKPLAGINVVIFGTSRGTVTDANGNFRIEVPNEKGQLVLSFVGYDFEKVDF